MIEQLPYAGGGGENDDFEQCASCSKLSRHDELTFDGPHPQHGCSRKRPHTHKRCPQCGTESVIE